jgi:hypothetical protein
MPYSFVFYPDPSSALLTVTPDSGGAYTSVPYVYTDGRQGQVAYIADGTPDNQGAKLTIAADGYEPVEMRGFLRVESASMLARLQVDDYKLKPAAATGGGTPPAPAGSSPFDIIMHVYNTTHPQLWTVEGCGKFTEDCCTALHEQHSPYWGHVDKDPGQNQFNGHAVDAIMLVVNVPGTGAGIYDIIFSSASSEAKPVFNFAGPPDPDNWVYPADAAQRGTPQMTIAYDRRDPKFNKKKR